MLRGFVLCVLSAPTLALQDVRVPDPWIDCNGNGQADSLDFGWRGVDDCNADGIPDECQFGQVLLFESFDGSSTLPPGVSYEFDGGLWHIASSCRPGGGGANGNFLYYGNEPECTFEVGPGPGTFWVHDVPLPAESVIRFHYWSYYEGELGGLAQCVYLEDFGAVYCHGDHSERVDHYCRESGTVEWKYRTGDLSSFAGQTVDILFYFQAGDGLFNDYFGWGVDDLRITTFEDISGNGVADLCERISQTYCDTNPNSTGHTAGLAALGSPDVADEDLFLRTLFVPNDQIGYYLMSLSQAQVTLPPPSQGILCLGAPLRRLNTMGNVQNSGDLGEIRLRLDFPTLPQLILPGETWNFQCWFRDGASSNTSRAVEVMFE